MKLDLKARSFSEQNAFFLAHLSVLAYEDKDRVKELLQDQGFWGDAEPAFEWFEVRARRVLGVYCRRIGIGMPCCHGGTVGAAGWGSLQGAGTQLPWRATTTRSYVPSCTGHLRTQR